MPLKQLARRTVRRWHDAESSPITTPHKGLLIPIILRSGRHITPADTLVAQDESMRRSRISILSAYRCIQEASLMQRRLRGGSAAEKSQQEARHKGVLRNMRRVHPTLLRSVICLVVLVLGLGPKNSPLATAATGTGQGELAREPPRWRRKDHRYVQQDVQKYVQQAPSCGHLITGHLITGHYQACSEAVLISRSAPRCAQCLTNLPIPRRKGRAECGAARQPKIKHPSNKKHNVIER